MKPTVVIVGAGPIGLTLAGLLSLRDIQVLVLEAHPGLSKHPKARGISARSMEVFRALGVEQAVREVSLPNAHIRFFRADTLASEEFVLSDPPATQERGHTPAPGVLCSQDLLEPVLLAHAKTAGTTVQFESRVTEVADFGDRVRVGYTQAGKQAEVEAAYVIGCDGARSIVREAAGVGLAGQTDLARFLSIRLNAPLTDVVRDRAAVSYFLAGGKGGFLAVDNRDEWIYQYPVPDGTNVAELQGDAGRLTELVRVAAGLPELEVTIRDTMVWRMSALLADAFVQGRMILAGDAAHQTPPTGGHGMNVGIGDADALAWRLADVLGGRAAERVFAQYSHERRAVARAVIDISLGNVSGGYAIDDELLLGTHYGAEPPVTAEPYAASLDAGRRLPHVVIGKAEGMGALSTLDLLPGRLAIVTELPDAAWAAAASENGVSYVPLRSPAAGERERGGRCPSIGLAAGEALLVRGDGHIAARLSAGNVDALVSELAHTRGR